MRKGLRTSENWVSQKFENLLMAEIGEILRGCDRHGGAETDNATPANDDDAPDGDDAFSADGPAPRSALDAA